MPKRKYRSKDFPNDSFVEYEVQQDGTLEIETAHRFEGQRNFDRTLVELSPDEARAMIVRVGRDLGLTVTET